jgi:hypothetical protein
MDCFSIPNNMTDNAAEICSAMLLAAVWLFIMGLL